MPALTRATRFDAPATSFTPPVRESRDALLAECLHSTIAGLPLPEAVRPRAAAAAAPAQPATVREGIERILGAGAVRP